MTNFILTIVFVIVVAVALFIFEKQTKLEGIDERQIIESLKSCTFGFFVLLFSCLISFLAIRNLELPFGPETLISISMFASVTAAEIREIWKNNNESKFLNGKISFGIISVAVAFFSIRLFVAYAKNGAIENQITGTTILICYAFVVIALVIRLIANKKACEE